VTEPEVLHDDEAKWVRLDVFVNEIAEENDVDDISEVTSALQDLIDGGVIMKKQVGDSMYITGVSMGVLLKAWVKNKGAVTGNSIKDRVRSFVR